jgi:hypothetical protein
MLHWIGFKCGGIALAYVSNYLTHFVGRSRASDQLRYELLKRIVRGGVLLDPAHIGRRDPIFQVKMSPGPVGSVPLSACPGLDYSSYPNVRHDLGSKLSDNSLVQFEIVCFCDIPQEEMAIHCAKYSCFGLAFPRPFLIDRGASPVMYVPRPGWFKAVIRSHDCHSGKLDKEVTQVGARAPMIDAAFDYHNHKLTKDLYMNLQECMGKAFRELKSFDDVQSVERDLQAALLYQTTVETLIFGHLKFFDPSLPPDHPDNYYMEREWRVAGKVEFAPGNIAALYVPPAFFNEAMRDFPDLAGRIVALGSNPAA